MLVSSAIAGGELVEGPSYEGDPLKVISDVSQSDMSWALGILDEDQIYKGWYGVSYSVALFGG